MAKVIRIGPAEEHDEIPGQFGRSKVVRIQTVGETSTTSPQED